VLESPDEAGEIDFLNSNELFLSMEVISPFLPSSEVINPEFLEKMSVPPYPLRQF
jgi:hypothetical protein